MNKKALIQPDPRAVILSGLCLSLIGLLVRHVVILAGAFCCAAAMAALLGAHPILVLKKLRGLFLIILAAALLQSAFLRSGAILLRIGGVTLLTAGGVAAGAMLLFRMSILIMTGAIAASCGTRRGIQALVQMKIPYEIAFMVFIALHFIPVLAQEMRDALTAIQLRGVDIGHIPWRRRIKVYTYLFIPVVSAAVIKARDLGAAIELRGFRAYPSRTSLERLVMRPADWFLIIGAIWATAGILMIAGQLKEGRF